MNNENRNQIRLTEGNSDRMANEEQSLSNLQRFEKFKKPLIYFLMAVVCAGCLYLIFKPKEKNLLIEDIGFNSAVPQAADDKLQSDKQKAYEQQLLEQKNEEKRNTLNSLSDYWNDGQATNLSPGQSTQFNSTDKPGMLTHGDQNAMNSYRNAQQTLGNFYSRDDQEVSNLKKEISRLKNESLQNNSTPKGSGINEQLELMEKSYQLAAKYLPSSPHQNGNITQTKPSDTSVKSELTEPKVKINSVTQLNKSVVSALYREPGDSAFLASLSKNNFIGIQGYQDNNQITQNSIRAVIHQTQLVTAESFISLRLSEPMLLGRTLIREGTLLKASCKFQSGRLQLKISSIEYRGSIQNVDISIHDNDGQLGLDIPYTPEQNAVNDIVANMSQSSGTNIMMTQSAGQQIASDLTRGVVQGVSGYFQRKVRMPKVTVKAGHQILLVAKN
ncbi:conjugative transposon protein TraM [Chryseobacterium balustinum]|uniref:Bacteroides conjugative transposon TraM protein n=1 Tax=Chryseobacterium balustinum TaxID=246 RepID=A0AAX2INE8_9FLAO|nr:conjugative transposon protein TraM [Chryseobacterium balustinum]SKC03019.1 Bacteroides conjugative transposon TraM protein [Chryseobacterium balustinum]SQA90947.1 Bacteroides conjugative transposon TraM protein [Chryseobacterium balustinum]